MPWKEKPKKPDTLIVELPYLMKKDALKKFHDRIVKEMKTGVVCLPYGAGVKIVSGNLKIQLESEETL